ncbi:MAG: DNA gyrase/topoisomerase IV subunit A, partial [Duncaniella sp.]|nr:DNA gyrase/topoisomerase IV subunit A [Duncaniella sp.]
YEGRGDLLGEFNSSDLILVVTTAGEFFTTSFDASNHYPENILLIEKFDSSKVWTAVLNDADQGYPYLKRFTFEATARPQRYLGDNEKSSLIVLTDAPGARFLLTFGGDDAFRGTLEVIASEFVAVKSYKAKGKRLTTFTLESVTELEPVEVEEPQEVEAEEIEVTDDDNVDAEPERSDDEVRDELTGQHRLFD